MTQPENGGVPTTDAQNGGAGTDVQTNNGGNDITKQFEELKAQFETLKRESSGKDRKIAEFLKEKEAFSISTKTKDEQLEHYKAQAEAYERKESFRQAFKDIGLNPDEFMEIVEEKDAKTQALKFANLLKVQKEESAKNALESYKTEELKKKGGVPPTIAKQVTKTNADVNASIRAALGR